MSGWDSSYKRGYADADRPSGTTRENRRKSDLAFLEWVKIAPLAELQKCLKGSRGWRRIAIERRIRSHERPAMYTLLIYEEVPENLYFYLLPNDAFDAEDMAIVRKTEGKYINTYPALPEDVQDACDCIQAAVAQKAEYLDEGHPEGSKWALRFAPYKVESPIEGKTITAVYHTGILL